MNTHMKPYVGLRDGKLEVFKASGTPTRASHGHLYGAVIGPFRTVRAARFTVETHPNPHVQHVRDAERLAADKL